MAVDILERPSDSITGKLSVELLAFRLEEHTSLKICALRQEEPINIRLATFTQPSSCASLGLVARDLPQWGMKWPSWTERKEEGARVAMPAGREAGGTQTGR